MRRCGACWRLCPSVKRCECGAVVCPPCFQANKHNPCVRLTEAWKAEQARLEALCK